MIEPPAPITPEPSDAAGVIWLLVILTVLGLAYLGVIGWCRLEDQAHKQDRAERRPRP